MLGPIPRPVLQNRILELQLSFRRCLPARSLFLLARDLQQRVHCRVDCHAEFHHVIEVEVGADGVSLAPDCIESFFQETSTLFGAQPAREFPATAPAMAPCSRTPLKPATCSPTLPLEVIGLINIRVASVASNPSTRAAIPSAKPSAYDSSRSFAFASARDPKNYRQKQHVQRTGHCHFNQEHAELPRFGPDTCQSPDLALGPQCLALSAQQLDLAFSAAASAFAPPDGAGPEPPCGGATVISNSA